MSSEFMIIDSDTPPPVLNLNLKRGEGVHRRSPFGNGFLHAIERGLILPTHYMADIGCGQGCIGLTLATKSEVENVILTDKNQQALLTAQGNADENALNEKCFFGLENAWGDEARTVVANLPQNPGIDACGRDGSDIQRQVIEELSRQNVVALYVKDISYAAMTVDTSFVTDRFEVEMIGCTYGKKPTSAPGPEIAQAQYFRLIPKT